LNVSQATLSEIWKGMGYENGRAISGYDADMVHPHKFPYSYYIYSAPAKQIYLLSPQQAKPIFYRNVISPFNFNLSK
jgi:hypothetical protein